MKVKTPFKGNGSIHTGEWYSLHYSDRGVWFEQLEICIYCEDIASELLVVGCGVAVKELRMIRDLSPSN